MRVEALAILTRTSSASLTASSFGNTWATSGVRTTTVGGTWRLACLPRVETLPASSGRDLALRELIERFRNDIDAAFSGQDAQFRGDPEVREVAHVAEPFEDPRHGRGTE